MRFRMSRPLALVGTLAAGLAIGACGSNQEATDVVPSSLPQLAPAQGADVLASSAKGASNATAQQTGTTNTTTEPQSSTATPSASGAASTPSAAAPAPTSTAPGSG